MKNESRHKLSLQSYSLALALAMEAVGTLFLFMDAIRLNTMVAILGFGGEPAKFHGLYHHAAPLGLLLVFVGMILHACCVWLKWASLRTADLFRTGSRTNPQVS